MNYKLINTHYTKFQERSGLLENNSTGNIEVVITKGDQNPKEVKSTTICPSGKMIYKLTESQSIWGISVSRIYSMINILSLNMQHMGSNLEVDGKSIDINKNGNLELFGFDSVIENNMRLKTKKLETGEIILEWFNQNEEIISQKEILEILDKLN